MSGGVPLSRNNDLVVWSHLRWHSVFQRPQQLMSRMASSRRVYFIEEPVRDLAQPPHLSISSPLPNLFVCTPHTPIASPGFCEQQQDTLVELIERFVREEGIESPVAWAYTPMVA